MSSPLLLALAVSLAAPDASIDFDAGSPTVPSEDVGADVAWTLGGAKFVWVSEKRDLVFQQQRRRAADLWVNEVGADGGLQWGQGRILCPAAEGEFFSSPRIASNARQTYVAWKVSTAGGDQIRGGELTATGVECGRVAYDPGPNVPLEALQLEESGDTFLLLWETNSNFVTLALSSPGALPQNIFAKPAAAARPRFGPSLAPRVGGFYVAWRGGLNGIDFIGQPLGALGAPQGIVELPFPGAVLSSGPVVVGPPLRTAFVGQYSFDLTPSSLKAGPVSNLNGTPLPSAAPDATGPLLASVERLSPNDAELGLTRVIYQEPGAPGRFLVDFSPMAGPPLPLPAGVEPLAMAGGFARSAVVSSVGGELTVATVSGAADTNTPLLGATTRTEQSQLEPSAVWLDTGVFGVGFNQGGAFRAGSVNPAIADRVLNPTTLSSDGGVYRLLPHDEDRGVAATIQAGGRSVLVVGTLTQGQLSAQPLLSVERPGLSHAVAGQNVGLLWAPGTSDLVFGAGIRPVPLPGLMTYGRCGVQVDNRLFVPAVGGSELKILVLEDAANTQPLTFTLSTSAAQVEPPCLAARGRELLVVANDADRVLRMWTLTVDELLASAQARELTGFPSRPGARDVKNPVAVGTRAGWQLAWESTDSTGGVIAEGKLSDQLVFVSGGQVSNGLDDRRPVLARSPNDDVVLVWEQFIDTLGAVIVRTRRLEQPNEADAGLPDGGPRDAGLVDGGGVEPTDAGTPDGGAADGGVSPAPVVFTACGCQGAGGPMVFSLALLLLAARRRRA